MFLLFTLINFSVYSQADTIFYRLVLSVFIGCYDCSDPTQPMQVISMISPGYLGCPLDISASVGTGRLMGICENLIDCLYTSDQNQWEEQEVGDTQEFFPREGSR